MSTVLKPEWWKHPLPGNLGHRNNFVLDAEEIAAVVNVLNGVQERTMHDRAEFAAAQRAIATKQINRFGIIPQPVTLVGVLEYIEYLLAASKMLVTLQNQLVRKHKEAAEAELRG
jgi:hypothetical protein